MGEEGWGGEVLEGRARLQSAKVVLKRQALFLCPCGARKPAIEEG
jgi:hypothetical protein